MSFSAFGTYKPWTKEEDAILRQFAEQCMPWKEISGLLPGRTVSACQTRWNLKVRTPADQKKYLQKKKQRENDHKSHQCKSDGPAIAGDHYVFKVPNGDPLLQRLIAVHGKDDNSLRTIEIIQTRGLLA